MRDRRQVRPVRKRRAEGNHLLHPIGPALRVNLGEESPAAVADQADPRTGLFLNGAHLAAQARQHALRVLHVEQDAREVRAVSDSTQPRMHHSERPVAGEETRDQKDRPAVPGRHPPAAEHGVLEQRRQLADRERVPQPHSVRW